jgi:peptidyl-prolyl cis-trans isomerase D
MAELFSDEVKKNKKNTSAIDVGNNTYIAARVVEVKETVQRPLTEVRLQIEQRMMREESNRLAKEEGEAKLAEAKAKKGTFNWPAALTVTRAKVGGLPPDVVDKALKADVSALPAFVGHASPQGTYFLIQVSKVNEVVVDDAKRKEYTDRMKQTQQSMDVSQVLASLKSEQPVNINKAMLEKKPQ